MLVLSGSSYGSVLQAIIKAVKPTKGKKKEKLAEDEEAKEGEEIPMSINLLDLTDSDVKAAVKQARELQANTQKMVAIINSLLRNDVKTTMKNDTYQSAYSDNDLLGLWAYLENYFASGSTYNFL